MKTYKFLDVGCKIGGSFYIANKYGFSASDGFGIDVRPQHIEDFIKAGYDGMLADARDIPFPDNTFELVIFNHVLEHMPNELDGIKALKECIRVSSKTVLITLPFFDEDEYLNSLGLKTYYSDWKGHTNKVHFKKLTTEWLAGYSYEYTMIKKIEDSSFSEIIPLTAPIDSVIYDESKHGQKPHIKFDRDIWREYTITVTK